MIPSVHIRPQIVPEPAQSALLLIAGKQYCSFGIINFLSKELSEFGYYSSNNDSAAVEKFISENELFQQRYTRALVAFDSPDVVLIPESLNSLENESLHLNAGFGDLPGSLVLSETNKSFGLQIVYRVSQSLITLLGRRFPERNFRCFNSLYFNSGIALNGACMYLSFKTNEYSLTCIRNRELLCSRTVSYSSPEEVVYYLLKVSQQYGLPQSEVSLKLSGMIEKDSSVFREMYKYFLNLEFEPTPEEIRLNESFREYPAHYFLPVSKLALCVS